MSNLLKVQIRESSKIDIYKVNHVGNTFISPRSKKKVYILYFFRAAQAPLQALALWAGMVAWAAMPEVSSSEVHQGRRLSAPVPSLSEYACSRQQVKPELSPPERFLTHVCQPVRACASCVCAWCACAHCGGSLHRRVPNTSSRSSTSSLEVRLPHC